LEQPGDEVVEKVWVWDQEEEESVGRDSGIHRTGNMLMLSASLPRDAFVEADTFWF
jgi:hypothetical protein